MPPSKYQNRHSRNRPLYILSAIGIIPVIYIAIIIAPYSQDGLISILNNINNIDIANILWVKDTPKVILLCLFFYAIAVTVFLSSQKRYHRAGVEQGSSDYADLKKLCKEFNTASDEKILYTQNFGISFKKKDLFKHKRNLNTVIIGGPGSGKTRGYVFPNILEATSSYVVLDCKGEICRTTAKFLEEKKHYKIKVLDLIHPERSWGYNPFNYITNDDDVQKIVTAIFKATTPPNSSSQDPFWDEAGKMLLSSLMYLLHYFGSEDEKNFPYLMNLIRAGKVSEDDDIPNPLDVLFEKVAQQYPEHICVRSYGNYRLGAAKTLQSVQITLLARLQKFELESIAGMMKTDEMELDKIADEPTILYCIIPDNDSSYNFIVSLLYIQLFQSLFDKADDFYHGRLPRLVHVIMDEFANVHTPEDFLTILGTCRSRNVAISIILQNLSQLKSKYKDGWENILGQCDEVLYLGGNEKSTHEYFSKILDKETIDTNNYNFSRGRSGSFSTNYQISGRELMTESEIRTMDYKYALLIISHSLPLVDEKYEITKHPNASKTPLLGDSSLEYHYPKRTDRNPNIEIINAEEITVKEEKPKTPFEMSVFDDITAAESWQMSVIINGTETPITEDSLASIVQQYDINIDELEEYIKN